MSVNRYLKFEKILHYKVATSINPLHLSWRRKLFFSVFVSWGAFHFIRKCISYIIPCLKNELSVIQIGILITILYLLYAISKIFTGFFSPYINTKLFIISGLVIVGLSNIIFSLTDFTTIMLCCLIINSFFQACAWSSYTKLLINYCNNSERGKWWGVCGASKNLSACLILMFTGFMSNYFNWHLIIYLSGFISIAVGILMVTTNYTMPDCVKGYTCKNNTTPIHQTINFRLNLRKWSFNNICKSIVTNFPLVIFSISGLFLFIIKTGISDWVPLYLLQVKKYDNLLLANSTVLWLEIGGFIGSILVCWSSDIIFKSRRLSTISIFALILAINILLFYIIPANHILVDNFCMFSIGLAIFGMQNVFSLFVAEMIIKIHYDLANNFIGSICNFGTTISALLFSMIINDGNWHGFFISIEICCLLMVVFIFLAQITIVAKNWNKSDNYITPTSCLHGIPKSR